MDDNHHLESYERTHDPVRVLALSDGVFAITIARTTGPSESAEREFT